MYLHPAQGSYRGPVGAVYQMWEGERMGECLLLWEACDLVGATLTVNTYAENKAYDLAPRRPRTSQSHPGTRTSHRAMVPCPPSFPIPAGIV